MKNAAATWLKRVFGSTKVGVMLFVLFLLSRVADTATTYRFLSASGWDHALEGNPVVRFLFAKIGFWPAAALGLVFAFAIYALIVHLLWKGAADVWGAHRAQRGCRAALLSTALGFFIVALHNETGLPDSLLPHVMQNSFWWGVGSLLIFVVASTAIAIHRPHTRKKKISP